MPCGAVEGGHKFDLTTSDRAASARSRKTDYLADGTLTFTGRVIDEHMAKTMNKAYLLPLFPVCPEKAPILFLDGSSSLNTTKSTGCIAWHIPPVPPPMKEEDSDGKAPPKKNARKVIGTSKIHHH